jgi:hypothetical protein
MYENISAGSGVASAARAACIVLLCAFAAPAQAQTPQEIAAAMPPSVSEVIVGGQWGEADAGGSYRAVLIYRLIDDVPVADILVQWLSFENGEAEPRVVDTRMILSVTGEPATTAFVAFDFGEGDAQTEATRLLIGSFDPQANTDETRFVRLGAPGEFEFVDAGSGERTGQ